MAGPNPVRRTRLALNTLEPRETPAGVVTANVAAGVLTITGDDADNVIQLKQTPAGIEVTGTDTAVTGGTQPFVGVTAIRAAMRDGNDRVTLDTTADLNLSGVSTFDLGDGDNTLYLSTAGKLDLGGLTILAGDGADDVVVAGGAGDGSVVRNTLSFSMGVGKNSQEPPYLNTQVKVFNLDVLGFGGLRLTGTEGNEELYLTKVNVRTTLNANGGDGTLAVTATDSTFGAVTLANADPGYGSLGHGTVADFTDTNVHRAFAVRSKSGVSLTLTDGSTGPVTVTTGPAGGGSIELAGAATVNGNLTVRGPRHFVSVGTGATAKVTGDVLVTATDHASLQTVNGSLTTRNVTLTGTGSGTVNFYAHDDRAGTPPPALTTTGALTLRGRGVQFSHQAGRVSVGGRLTILAGREAWVHTGVAYGREFPPAKTSVAGPALIRGRQVEYQQSESEATYGAGLTLEATEHASFESLPWRLPGDPNWPDYPPYGAGATTAVTGGLTIRGRGASFKQTEGTVSVTGAITLAAAEEATFETAPKELGTAPDGSDVWGLGAKTTAGALTITGEGVGYYQAEGEASFAAGMTLTATGAAALRTEAGNTENRYGAKLSVPTGSVLVRGGQAEMILEDGEATVSGNVTVRGAAGGQFNLETYDSFDGGKFAVGGSLAVTGGAGEVMFSGSGQSLKVGGDLTMGGQQLNRIWLESELGTEVGGDIRVAGATGDHDWFIVGSPLTVAGDTSVALGGGPNTIELGLEEGTVRLGGNLTLTTGSGSDVIAIASTTVAGNTTINTGAGADRLHLLADAVFEGTVTADLGGGADTFEAGLPYGGFDPIPAGPVAFNAAATVRMGIGNDTLRLGVAGDGAPGEPDGKLVFGAAGSLTVDGGANLNLFDDEAGDFDPAKVTTLNFVDPTP